MSDEFVEVDHDLYQHCELVIRSGSAHFEMFDDQKFIQIPLGYVTGLHNSSQTCKTSTKRMYSFSFLGAIKHERETEMLPALQAIRGAHFVRKTESFAATLEASLSGPPTPLSIAGEVPSQLSPKFLASLYPSRKDRVRHLGA